MDRMFGLIFLGLGWLLNLPVVQHAVGAYSIEWIWLELALWIAAPIFLLIGGNRSSSESIGSASQRATLASIAPGLLIALASLLWGAYSSSIGWSLRGMSIGASCLLVLLVGATDRRLFQMIVLGMLVPISTWTFAYEVHWLGQKLATSFAGSVLDLAKIFHFYKGNVIGLVSTDFLENEQCSGIRLLATALLVSLTLGFLGSYSWFRMIYLTLVTLFWVVVWNALRLAYCVWMQDGQPNRLEHNLLIYDVVSLVGILFFTWSGDQFFAALTYQEKEVDKEDFPIGESASIKVSSRGQVPLQRSPFQSSFGLLLSAVAIAGILGLGGGQISGWIGPTKGDAGSFTSHQVQDGLERLALTTGQEDGWSVTRTEGAAESFAPLYRPFVVWPHQQWELTNERLKEGSMRLRVDGLWSSSMSPEWLWRWYGWQTGRRTGEPQDTIAFGMSRSIVEEGYVVSRRLYLSESLGAYSPYVQVSLVQESVRPISQEEQILQRDLFTGLYDQIQRGLSDPLKAGVIEVEAP